MKTGRSDSLPMESMILVLLQVGVQAQPEAVRVYISLGGEDSHGQLLAGHLPG